MTARAVGRTYLLFVFALAACGDDVGESGGGTGAGEAGATATTSGATSTASNPSAEGTSAGTTATTDTEQTDDSAIGSTSSGSRSGSSEDGGSEDSDSEGPGSTGTGSATTCEQVTCVGNTLWSRRFGDTMAGYAGVTDLKAHDLGTYIAGTCNPEIDPDSSVVVVGAFNGTADFGEGGVASLGPLANQAGRDVFATKLDVDLGATIWSRQVGDSNQQFAEQVALGVGIDPGGNVWVGGRFEGVFNWGDGELTASGGFSTPDGFVAKLSP